MLGIFKKFRNFVRSKFLIVKLFTLNVVFFTKLMLILFSIVFAAILLFSHRIHSKIDDFFSQKGFVITEVLLTGNDLVPSKTIASKVSREVYICGKNDEICTKEFEKECEKDLQQSFHQNSRQSSHQVLQKSLTPYKSSVFLNVHDLAHCVSSIPLVSKVYVHRDLPNKLYIKVEEYEVLARVVLVLSRSSGTEFRSGVSRVRDSNTSESNMTDLNKSESNTSDLSASGSNMTGSDSDDAKINKSEMSGSNRASQMSNSESSSVVMSGVLRRILNNVSNARYYLVLNNNTLVQMKNVDLSVKKFPIVFVSKENINEFQEDISGFANIVAHMNKIISEKLSAMSEGSNYHVFFEFNDSNRYSILLIQKGSKSAIASDLMIDFANMVFSLNGEINSNIKSEFYKIFKRKLSGFFVKLRRKNYEGSMIMLRNFLADYSMDSKNSLILVDLRMKNKILLRKW